MLIFLNLEYLESIFLFKNAWFDGVTCSSCNCLEKFKFYILENAESNLRERIQKINI